MKTKITIMLIIACFFSACKKNYVITLQNNQKGKLFSEKELYIYKEKKFELDSISAPLPKYMQFLIIDGIEVLTFLNTFDSSIYLYDYEKCCFIKKYSFKQDTPNEIRNPGAYFIIDEDSTYILDMAKMSLSLLNLKKDSLLYVVSLKGTEGKNWPKKLPQYALKTSSPIYKTGKKLILTGALFWSIPSNDINKFHFSAHVNTDNGKMTFHHQYPEEVYSHDVNWEGGLQTVANVAITPTGKIVYSFPPSHNLYIANIDSDDYISLYGGSNFAGNILSIDYADKRKTPREKILENYIQQDMYGPIIYDPHQHVFYRFLYKKVANKKTNLSIQEKDICIILMDEDFKYLGESIIGNGREWNTNNSFVTPDGLCVEYIADKTNEDYLKFKVFKIK